MFTHIYRKSSHNTFSRVLAPPMALQTKPPPAGISSLPTASDGAELPTARLVSLAVGSLPNSSPASRSFLHVLFGFFLALDVTATPLLAGTRRGASSVDRLASGRFILVT